jgi:hypothetical protein
MPVIIIQRRGRHCPAIECDHCGQRIRTARDGNVQWALRAKGPMVYFTHKRCCHAFEEANPGILWGAMELSQFPLYLANSLKASWTKAARDAARMEQLA